MSARPEKIAALRRPEDPAPEVLLKSEAVARKRVPRGGYLYRSGDPADPLYMVESGMVKTTVCSASGRDLTLGLYGPGELFGEEAVLPRDGRMSYAVAVEQSVVLRIPRTHVHRLLEKSPAVSLYLTRLLAARAKESAHQMEKLAWSPVSARLAEALLRLACKAGVVEPTGTRVNLRMTHQELANLIGSTRETTTATLNDFRRKGLIECVRRHIVLLRPDTLSTLAVG